jgi:flagellar hook-length control protein FliK
MLEPNAQAILSAQKQSVGFDAAGEDTASSNSTGNSAFSTEYSRAQESLAVDKSSHGATHDSSTELNQSSNHLSAGANAPTTDNDEPSAAATKNSNSNGVATEVADDRAGNNQSIDSDQSTNTTNYSGQSVAQGTVGRGNLNLALTIDAADESQLASNAAATANVDEQQSLRAAVGVQVDNSTVSSQEDTNLGNSPDAAGLDYQGGLIKAAVGEQNVQMSSGSKLTNNDPALDTTISANQFANLRQSSAAPDQAVGSDWLGDGAILLSNSDNAVLAEKNQQFQTASGQSSLMAGLDASNSAGNSTASATPVALANTESNAGTSSQAKTQGNVQQGANTFLNTGYAGEYLNGNSTAAGIVATNAEIGKNATAHVTSPESGAVSGAAAQSAASVKSVTQEIVAGHEFLRSIANPQSDTQPVIAQTTTGNADTRLVNSGNAQPVGVQALGTSGALASLANTAPLSVSSDTTVPRNIAQAQVGKLDSSDTLSSNGLSVVRGLSAKNGSATNSEAASAQAVLQQASGKLDVNANQQTMVNPAMHNVVANQVKATDVTLQNQIKQLIGAKQQPEISALQAANNPIDTPSSNVYHVTTNGIITANSTSLNAAPLSDLAIAPRTVLLDQPGADQALAENLRWAVNEKLSRLTVNVSPANLGPISVSVDVENQNMSVSIVTNNTIAKEAIDNILPRMREHFSSEGYQQVSVDVSSQQERNSNLRNQTADSFHDQSESGSDSRQAETQNSGSSQYDSTAEQVPFLAEHQPSSQSLIDTYA